MFGYWKQVFKVTKMLVKWLIGRKTKFAKQILWFIIDTINLVAIAYAIFLITNCPPMSFYAIIISVVFFVGHMVYLDLEQQKEMC